MSNCNSWCKDSSVQQSVQIISTNPHLSKLLVPIKQTKHWSALVCNGNRKMFMTETRILQRILLFDKAKHVVQQFDSRFSSISVEVAMSITDKIREHRLRCNAYIFCRLEKHMVRVAHQHMHLGPNNLFLMETSIAHDNETRNKQIRKARPR